MTGSILLAGGAEFSGAMAIPDRRAIDRAGGLAALISIVPTAAAPDNNHERAGENGKRWFETLGAKQVQVLPLIDSDSANQAEIAAQLERSKLIYLLGGFTHYLGQTLKDSLAWQAIMTAYQAGAVVAGSSAGAMVLCEHYFNPDAGAVVDGLGLLPNRCVLPHHNTFGQGWADRLTEALPQATLIGIDERTGLLSGDTADSEWQVYGQGKVTLYRDGQVAAAYANRSTLTFG